MQRKREKLERGTDELDWMREALPIWGCGCAVAAVWFLYGFSCDLRVLFREANWDRASRGKRSKREREKFDECYNFWFIYKTYLTSNQNPLKLHQRSRLKKILNGGFRFRGYHTPFFLGGGGVTIERPIINITTYFKNIIIGLQVIYALN